MPDFEITTREIVHRTYICTADSEEAAREAFENGDITTSRDSDAEVDEILSIDEMED